ncbi:MAG: PAS domain S-box protein [Candidatus Omnitrophota bacterium]
MRKKIESKHSYLALFSELCSNPMLVLGLSGSIQYINPAAKKMFSDLELLQLEHPFLHKVKSAMPEIIANKDYFITWNIESGEKWFEQFVHFSAKNSKIYIHAFDITDSKYVQENIPLPYQSLDINGHIIKVNNEWLELLGYSKDKVIGKWFGDFLFQEYREKFLEKFAILKEKGQIYDAEYAMIKKDGSVINVSFNGRVIYDVKGNFKNTHCVMHNITSHKQVEEKCLRHQDDLELRVQKRTLELAAMNVELKEEIAAREKKEAEILALENRLEFILGATNTGLDIIDCDYNVCYVDPEWAKKYGDYTGRKCYEYFMGLKEKCPDCGVTKALETKKAVITEDSLPKEENRPIQVITIPFQDENKKWFVAEVNVDIRERKKIEQSLQESQQRYKKIVSSLIDYIYTVYIEKGRIVDVKHSLACLAVTGYAAQEFKLNPFLWIDMVHKDDRKKVLQWGRRISKGEQVEAIEHRIICKNKKMKWIRNTPVFHYSSNKELVSYDGVVQDITDRKIAEQHKAELEAVKTIIDGMADAIVVIDADGKITQFNKSFVVNFGYDKDVISGSFSQLFRQEDKPLFMEGIVECFRRGWLNNFEIGIYTRDKKLIPVLLNLRVLKDDNENIKGIIAVITDITKFKHIEELKDEFVNTVSHELRTPLSAIKEGVAIVLEEMAGKLNPKQKDFLQTAEKNINRLTHLVNDILNYQKLSAGKVRFSMIEVNINDLVKEVSKELMVLVQVKGLELRFILKESLPKIKLDPDRIAEVLVNLINNAIKYTQKGRITIQTFMQEDELCVSVEDTGIGIKKDDIPKLFTSFSQISKSAGSKDNGVGLGLLISRKIVQEHKGRIWLESEYGKGSKFIFSLLTRR